MNKITKTILAILPVGAFALPVSFASAQTEIGSNVTDIVSDVEGLVNSLIPLVAAIALLAFFWGLAKYVFQADDEEAKEKGKNIMIGGIVALFLIAAIGGIIGFLVEAFGFDQGETIDYSTIDSSSD